MDVSKELTSNLMWPQTLVWTPLRSTGECQGYRVLSSVCLLVPFLRINAVHREKVYDELLPRSRLEISRQLAATPGNRSRQNEL